MTSTGFLFSIQDPGSPPGVPQMQGMQPMQMQPMNGMQPMMMQNGMQPVPATPLPLACEAMPLWYSIFPTLGMSNCMILTYFNIGGLVLRHI